MSERYIPKYLNNDITDTLSKLSNVKKIQTSVNLAVYMLEAFAFNYTPNNLTQSEIPIIQTLDPYKFGEFKGIDIYIDPILLSDMKVLFFDEKNNIIHILKIDKDLYDGQNINEERSNKLKMILIDYE